MGASFKIFSLFVEVLNVPFVTLPFLFVFLRICEFDIC